MPTGTAWSSFRRSRCGSLRKRSSRTPVLALARQQMAEMIEQAGNHPSIFAWSVANESATARRRYRVFSRHARFHPSNRSRPVCQLCGRYLPKLERAEQSAANDADFLMMNQYFGTWHGRRPRWVRRSTRSTACSRKDGDCLGVRLPGFYAKDPVQADPTRIRTLQQQMPILAARDWIAGAIQWCYQDYKSPRNYGRARRRLCRARCRR